MAPNFESDEQQELLHPISHDISPSLLGAVAGRVKSSGARWYAVQCLANREAGALAHLRNQGFNSFLPRRRKTRRHARKLDIVLAPFFPGYLFVQLDLSRDRWRSVNGTYGVARIVMQRDLPAPVPRGVVEALWSACDGDGVLPWSGDLHPGQAVRIQSGPFSDFIGELDQLDDGGRIRVLLDIMGGKKPVVLARSNVIPADSSA